MPGIFAADAGILPQENLGVDEKNFRINPDAKDDLDHETESYDEESAVQFMMALDLSLIHI
eukprot:9703912-Alexandrium_andersonii.AAC.1